MAKNNKKQTKSNKFKNGHLEINDELITMMENGNQFSDVVLNGKVDEVDLSKFEQPSMAEQMLDTIPEKLKETTKEEIDRLEKLEKDLSNFGKPSENGFNEDEEIELPESLSEIADKILNEKKAKKKAKREQMRKEMNLEPDLSIKQKRKLEKKQKKEYIIANETEEEKKARLKREEKKAQKKEKRSALEDEMEMKQEIRYDMLDNFGKKKNKKKDTETLNNSNIKTLSILVSSLSNTKFGLAIKAVQDKYEKLNEEKDNITEEYFDTVILPFSKLITKLVNSTNDADVVRLFKRIADLLLIEDLFAETMEANLEAMLPGETLDDIVIKSLIETIEFPDHDIKDKVIQNSKDYREIMKILRDNITHFEGDLNDLVDRLTVTDAKSNVKSLEDSFNNHYIRFNKGSDIARLLLSRSAVGRLTDHGIKDYIIEKKAKSLNAVEIRFVKKVNDYKSLMK